jgi:hypothetical protein
MQDLFSSLLQRIFPVRNDSLCQYFSGVELFCLTYQQTLYLRIRTCLSSIDMRVRCFIYQLYLQSPTLKFQLRPVSGQTDSSS